MGKNSKAINGVLVKKGFQERRDRSNRVHYAELLGYQAKDILGCDSKVLEAILTRDVVLMVKGMDFAPKGLLRLKPRQVEDMLDAYLLEEDKEAAAKQVYSDSRDGVVRERGGHRRSKMNRARSVNAYGWKEEQERDERRHESELDRVKSFSNLRDFEKSADEELDLALTLLMKADDVARIDIVSDLAAQMRGRAYNVLRSLKRKGRIGNIDEDDSDILSDKGFREWDERSRVEALRDKINVAERKKRMERLAELKAAKLEQGARLQKLISGASGLNENHEENIARMREAEEQQERERLSEADLEAGAQKDKSSQEEEEFSDKVIGSTTADEDSLADLVQEDTMSTGTTDIGESSDYDSEEEEEGPCVSSGDLEENYVLSEVGGEAEEYTVLEPGAAQLEEDVQDQDFEPGTPGFEEMYRRLEARRFEELEEAAKPNNLPDKERALSFEELRDTGDKCYKCGDEKPNPVVERGESFFKELMETPGRCYQFGEEDHPLFDEELSTVVVAASAQNKNVVTGEFPGDYRSL